MYKVRVEFYIRSNEKEELTIPFAVAYRDTDLPFAPFIGLRFHFGIGAAEQLPTIKIAWNDKEQSFRCRLEDDLPGDGIETSDYNGLKQLYAEDGWTILETPTEP